MNEVDEELMARKKDGSSETFDDHSKKAFKKGNKAGRKLVQYLKKAADKRKKLKEEAELEEGMTVPEYNTAKDAVKAMTDRNNRFKKRKFDYVVLKNKGTKKYRTAAEDAYLTWSVTDRNQFEIVNEEYMLEGKNPAFWGANEVGVFIDKLDKYNKKAKDKTLTKLRGEIVDGVGSGSARTTDYIKKAIQIMGEETEYVQEGKKPSLEQVRAVMGSTKNAKEAISVVAKKFQVNPKQAEKLVRDVIKDDLGEETERDEGAAETFNKDKVSKKKDKATANGKAGIAGTEVNDEIEADDDINESRQFSKSKWADISIKSLNDLLKGSGYTVDTKSVKYPAMTKLPAFNILKDGQPTKGYLIIRYEPGKFGIESSFVGDDKGKVIEWKPTAQPSWNPTKDKVISLISEESIDERYDAEAEKENEKNRIETSKIVKRHRFANKKPKSKKIVKEEDDLELNEKHEMYSDQSSATWSEQEAIAFGGRHGYTPVAITSTSGMAKSHQAIVLFDLLPKDKLGVKGIKLKSGEKVFRYASPATIAGKMMPYIKANLAKGLYYFLTQASSSGEIDEVEFERKAEKARFTRVISGYMREEAELEEGGPAKNYTRQGGNGEHKKWKVTLTNGKTKTVKADSKKNAKDRLSPNELIIGVKSITLIEESELEEAHLKKGQKVTVKNKYDEYYGLKGTVKKVGKNDTYVITVHKAGQMRNKDHDVEYSGDELKEEIEVSTMKYDPTRPLESASDSLLDAINSVVNEGKKPSKKEMRQAYAKTAGDEKSITILAKRYGMSEDEVKQMLDESKDLPPEEVVIEADEEKSEDKPKMDKVDKEALKKKFKKRKDKDIDNDGDVDDSDEYLHKRRKAISKDIDEEEITELSRGTLDSYRNKTSGNQKRQAGNSIAHAKIRIGDAAERGDNKRTRRNGKPVQGYTK